MSDSAIRPQECGVNWNAKSDAGLTALEYAKKAKYDTIIAWFARGGAEEEEEEVEDEVVPFISYSPMGPVIF